MSYAERCINVRFNGNRLIFKRFMRIKIRSIMYV